MNYIVMDLEWNQPLSRESSVYKQVGDRLIFEMIQIGAVKLDESCRLLDSISQPIHPSKYLQIHPRIRRMTHITEETLEDAPLFPEALQNFEDWCGEDYILMTWGCDDVSVMQQNIDFFGCESHLPPICDLQQCFSKVFGSKERKGLKAAMEMLEIEEEEDLYFHDARNDAYYTAKVLARLPEPKKVTEFPLKPKPLIRKPNAAPGSKAYDSIEAALASEEAQHPKCGICGKQVTLDGSYIYAGQGKYLTLAVCPHHKKLMVRMSVKESGGKVSARISVSRAGASNVAYIHTKQYQLQLQAAAGNGGAEA